MIRDIHPKSPITRLRRDFTGEELARRVETKAAAAAVGMSYNFAVRAAGFPSGSRPSTISLEQVLSLLEVDGYQETFVPRSMVPDYLLRTTAPPAEFEPLPTPELDHPLLVAGHVGDLLRRLPVSSVQCAVTSSPYWGMRVYDNQRDIVWADGERCPYGFEQTPEGFIRHTVEVLHLLKPAMTSTGSVWWNLMDTYNTRTPIRGSSRDKLRAMEGDPDHALGWTEHEACRHSAGHLYLDDGELASIPMRIAERASRIGYRLKSFITWNKHSTPEPVQSRVTRQAEYIIHLVVGRTSFFDKRAWQALEPRQGGPSPRESAEKVITDVWSLPVASGANGHGAEFPLSLPGRCIALTSQPGDMVLDPFVGSGTSALAAKELGRRFVGFDISKKYVELSRGRVNAATAKLVTDGSPNNRGERAPDKRVNGSVKLNGTKGATGMLPFSPAEVARARAK